jgi:hypothetical protein
LKTPISSNKPPYLSVGLKVLKKYLKLVCKNERILKNKETERYRDREGQLQKGRESER